MARTTPTKSKTVTVQSGVNVGGLTPGQIAEVDDTQQVRDLIEGGLWTLVVKKDVEEAQELELSLNPPSDVPTGAELYGDPVAEA